MVHGWAALFLAACGDPGLEPWNIKEGSVLVVSPSGDVTFAEIPIGSVTTRVLALQADGDSDIEIRELAFSEDTAPEFVLEDVSLPLRVAVNDIVSVEVYFEPESAGTFNGTISISDGESDRALTRRLIGFACDPAPTSDDCE